MASTDDEFILQPRPRLSFQEMMELTPVTTESGNGASNTKRFVSRRQAWKLGPDLAWKHKKSIEEDPRKSFGRGAYGGHVYIQAPLAAARVVEKEDELAPAAGKLGLHSIQGVFTNPGLTDRPFIFDVSSVNSTRSFTTRLVNARQPTEPSHEPDGPYPTTDAEKPLGDVRFSCLVTFKRPVAGPDDCQLAISAQEQYADILDSRPPDAWEPCPLADIDFVRDMFPPTDHGSFPILDMYKVDMTAFNEGKPVPERRQLTLYRLYKPLPSDDVNAHILCHAFEADRNGLIMLGNHLGYGYRMGPAASLSYAFYVHVNPEECIMRGDGWWLQELCWPRVSAGRGLMESKIWSPEGKHVASGYQDGMILPLRGLEKGKI